MLKRLFILCFFLGCSKFTISQNLVQNGDFEQFITCPNDIGQLNKCFGWSFLAPDADYFNVCSQDSVCDVPKNYFGFAYPHSKNAYIGLCTGDVIFTEDSVYDVREYVGGVLIDSLIQDEDYILSFYVTKSDNYWYSSNNLGVYFTQSLLDPINSSCWCDVDTLNIDYSSVVKIDDVICDTTQWQQYSFNYKAKGGEKYLYLGNFYPDALTTYIKCYEKTNQAIFNNRFSYYFIDDVALYRADSLNSVSETLAQQITLFPNPATNTITISTGNPQNAQAALFDISGRKLFQQKLTASQEKIDVSGYANGIYICTITANGKVVKREKVVISH